MSDRTDVYNVEMGRIGDFVDWKNKYKDKIVTPEKAVSYIQSGDKVIFGDWLGEPAALVQALVERAPELKNVGIIHGMSPGPNAYMDPALKDSFYHISLFLGAKTRPGYYDGSVEYIGTSNFDEWPRMFATSDLLNPHWAMIQLSPPDENGMCSFGNDCSFTEPAARTASKVIAQINSRVPYVKGKMMSIRDIDYIVPSDDAIYTIPKGNSSDPITQKIAENIADLVEDGATLQLGIGKLPDAIASLMKDKKHLGVHTETLTESLKELIEVGALDNSRKTLHPGVCVGSQAAGTQEFFDFLNNNDMFELYPVDYVNNPYVIGKNYKMTSINSTIEVDLYGQANSESIGGRMYSGIGGQLDYVRGAQISAGGKSILALQSTTKDGKISKIVPTFKPGTIISVGRYDIQYVVTEYGVANLKFKTMRQRAEALINIAHPDFREQLRFDAKKMGLLH